MLGNKAKCERTDKKIPLIDGYFVGNPQNGEWVFVCKDAPQNRMDYNIPVSSIIGAPEELVDWLAQLNEKTWFDAKKFLKFFENLRDGVSS